MTVILPRHDRPVAIRHQLKAGNDFEGLAPADGATPLVPSFDHDTWKYADGTHGGLFDPYQDPFTWQKRDSLLIAGVELKLGGQSAWSLALVDPFGTETVLRKGTNETSFVQGVHELGAVVMLWGSMFKLTTTGASGAMVATLKFGPNDRCLGMSPAGE
jgi:hypothetical protein